MALDPPDLIEMSRGSADRESKRLKLIKGFMSWAYLRESDRWTQANNEERIIVKRNFSYGRFLAGFAILSNVTLYHAFLVGIYDFRSTELINMKRVPFAAKLAVSSFLSFYMTKMLWEKQIYEPDLYRLAIKYRT